MFDIVVRKQNGVLYCARFTRTLGKSEMANQVIQGVLGLLANLKQHVRLSEVCLVEATSDNNLSVERNSMSN
jgi:hypothetical protein